MKPNAKWLTVWVVGELIRNLKVEVKVNPVPAFPRCPMIVNIFTDGARIYEIDK